MCHVDKKGDGCHGKGVGNCGGNLLQTNLSSGRGVRGLVDRVRFNARSVAASVAAFNSVRRSADG